jgi:hypothetical protein
MSINRTLVYWLCGSGLIVASGVNRGLGLFRRYRHILAIGFTAGLGPP